MTVDVDALREYLLDLCGTAAFEGFSTALLDVTEIEHAKGEELLRIALRLGVDPSEFEAR